MRSDKRNLLQDYFYKNYEDSFKPVRKRKKRSDIDFSCSLKKKNVKIDVNKSVITLAYEVLGYPWFVLDLGGGFSTYVFTYIARCPFTSVHRDGSTLIIYVGR